jgi:hypothetical protein
VVDKKRKHFLYKANTVHQAMKWKPSIHMPKAAARIWLQVESIAVERLRDITEEDAIAEGVNLAEGLIKGEMLWKDYEHDLNNLSNPKSSFKTLWRSINGAESWEANPWVWVVRFKVVSTTGREAVQL